MAQQLRLDAIEAKINGDFLPDRLARGFNWVSVVLDHPVDDDQRAQVEGHRIIVQHLELRGQRVRGVLLFCTSTSGSGTIVVEAAQIAELGLGVTLFLALAKALITMGLEPEAMDRTVLPTPAVLEDAA